MTRFPEDRMLRFPDNKVSLPTEDRMSRFPDKKVSRFPEESAIWE